MTEDELVKKGKGEGERKRAEVKEREGRKGGGGRESKVVHGKRSSHNFKQPMRAI